MGFSKSQSSVEAQAFQINERAFDVIDDRVLSYVDDGYRWVAIDIFWHPLGEAGVQGEMMNQQPQSADFFQPRRPPGSWFAANWRLCHMGVILTATREGSQTPGNCLCVAVDQLPKGFRVVDRKSFSSFQSVVEELTYAADAGVIYSAGIRRQVNQPLDLLQDFVNSERARQYDELSNICQQFAARLYERFTGQNLSREICLRWS